MKTRFTLLFAALLILTGLSFYQDRVIHQQRVLIRQLYKDALGPKVAPAPNNSAARS